MIITDQSSSPPRYRGSPIISDDQRLSFLDDRSSLTASTRPPTPIIEDDDQHSIRSASTRLSIPILEREQQSDVKYCWITMKGLKNKYSPYNRYW